MDKRVLLLKVENENVYNPLGLLYVGSYLKKHGYDVELEIIPGASFSRSSFLEEKARAIAGGRYLFVGFSVLTGPQTKFSALLSKKIKEYNRDVPIVWGGIHPSLMKAETLKEEYVDIVVVNEGEETALELAQALSRGNDITHVDGIGYKTNGRTVFNKGRALIEDLDTLPVDWSLIDMDKCIFEVQGRRLKGFIYLTSRGCPYDCSFCYNRAFNQRRWRTHSIDRVVGDIEQLKKRFNVETVAFMDDHFFVNKNRSFEILSRMRDLDISCAEFLLRVDEITEESVKRLASLGVKRIFIGVESGNDRVLALMKKDTSRAMIIEKFRILARYRDLAINCAMIIGYPTETMEEIEESLDLGIELSGMIPGIVVTYQTFLPFPGTDAYDLALKEGFRPPDRTEDYEVFDTFGARLPLTWLPWADERTSKIFYRIDKYGKLLTHSDSTSIIRTISKKLLYHLAVFRLKHRFFAFPFEISVLFRFNRYYNPECRI